MYDRYRLIDEGDGAAIQVRGHAEGREDAQVITRFEIRPCEPGLRVRTEVRNRGVLPVGAPGDIFFWGGRGQRPFAPYPGGGFEHGDAELSDVVAVPWIASAPAAPGEPSYACVPCLERALTGVHGDAASFVGEDGRAVEPGATSVYERFIGVADGAGAAPGVSVALAVRSELFGEGAGTIRGTVAASPTLGDAGSAAVIVTTRGSGGVETPVAYAVPDATGAFETRVTVGVEHSVSLVAFGRVRSTRSVPALGAPDDEASVSFDAPDAATLEVSLTLDGSPAEAFVTLEPADDMTRSAVAARDRGALPSCAPLLGPPRGGPVGCQRAAVDRTATLLVPPGHYFVYAMRGPFATVARREITVAAGDTTPVALALTRAAVQPTGTLALDLHAHGASSFDSAISDDALVTAVLAAGLDAAVVTDHDVVHDYGPAVAARGAGSRVSLYSAVETTPLVPFAIVPGAPPRTGGRLGFFPLEPVASAPWRGAPADEGVEPGILMTRVDSEGWSRDDGLVTLHTPWGAPRLGRDVGFPRAVGIDARTPIPAEPDGSANGSLVSSPPGSRFTNDGWDAVEVMNADDWPSMLADRALWFYLLDQGVLRAGVASSGARGVGVSFPGAARTIVWADSAAGSVLASAVRSGRTLATNGPIVEVTMRDADGADHGPSLDDALVPPPSPSVHIRVRAAAWTPVDEVRVVVNGRVAASVETRSTAPADPFGPAASVRWEGDVFVEGALPFEIGDAWLVVEAGTPLPATGDLDCDGIPDTGDNDGNGVIDAADVGVNAGASTPTPDVTSVADVCLPNVGPLRVPRRPDDRSDPDCIFASATGAPFVYAVTSPILVDVDGGGYQRRD